jgi:hypothetical protein
VISAVAAWPTFVINPGQSRDVLDRKVRWRTPPSAAAVRLLYNNVAGLRRILGAHRPEIQLPGFDIGLLMG